MSFSPRQSTFQSAQMYSNPLAAQIRIRGKSAKCVGGQRAHDLRMGPLPEYVDASRIHLNRVLIVPQTGRQLRRICEERRAMRVTSRAMKSSAAVGVVGIISFGHEAQKIFSALTLDEQDAAYLATAEAVARRLNTTLSGLVVHVDESAPHAHFQLPAYDLSGHPISETAKRGVMCDLQSITAQVMSRHAPGIERGRSRIDRLKAGASHYEVTNRSVAQLHNELLTEIAAREARLAELDAQIERNERLAIRALEKAAADERRSEKALKNAAIYEQRAERARQQRHTEECSIRKLQLARSTEEERMKQLTEQQEGIRQNALKEAREAAAALLVDAKNQAAEKALHITAEMAERLEQQLLSEGQRALLKVQRERDLWRTAFELLRDTLKHIVPGTLYKLVKDRFTASWRRHLNAPNDQMRATPSRWSRS